MENPAIVNSLQFLNKTFKPFNLGSLYIAPTYWQAGAIVLLLFMLVFTLARLRHVYVNWSLKSAPAMLFFGFLLALILEGFLVLSGKTFLTVILGWKNPPKPISTTLDIGREKLIDTLGVKDEIPTTLAKEEITSDYLIKIVSEAPQVEAEKFYKAVCKP